MRKPKIKWRVHYLPNQDILKPYYFHVEDADALIKYGRSRTLEEAMSQIRVTIRREFDSYRLSGVVRNIQDLEAL